MSPFTLSIPFRDITGLLSALISCPRKRVRRVKETLWNSFQWKETEVIHLNSITIYFFVVSIIRTALFIWASLCNQQLQNRVNSDR